MASRFAIAIRLAWQNNGFDIVGALPGSIFQTEDCRMVKIFTDSVADLGKELTSQRNIQVIPLLVYSNGKTYHDGVDITLEGLYADVQVSGQLPKTSAPSLTDFLQAFDQPEEILYIGLSSKLSATWQNATQARAMLPNRHIHLVNSLNLSTGLGLLALKAADLRDAGLDGTAIAAQVTTMIPQVRTSFVIETLEYLYKGGRCSALQNIVGALLHIRPVIAMRTDGTLGIKNKIRGSRSKALQSMIDDFCQQLPQVDLEHVFITHTGCDEDAQYLREELMRHAPIQQVNITLAGSVVASHCGPDTIGIIYRAINTEA